MLNPIVIAIPLFALAIAFEAWYDDRQNADACEWWDSWTNILIGFVSVATAAIIGFFIGFIYDVAYDFAPFKFPADAWWTWTALFLLDDFAYYWFHRVSHESRLFWNFHVVHHSSEQYNLSVAVRQSWFTGILHWIFYAPIMLLGFAPWMFLAMHGFNLIYQFWIHTKFVKNLGWLEWILNTPSHHRVHHGVNEPYLDRNYAGVLIVWDRMFGSFVSETETPRYGIIKPIKSNNPLWINTHAWFEMFEAIKEKKTLIGKLRCVFASPNMDFYETHQKDIAA
ncbi:MAG TPA: sterol desaturase family protein [Pyrinomonadaceae bacterium]|jgi:sterol desaturase/sphingolipid hydroxylase (fatty acid hydroxylase superfamily)|nr:sterol desaturase family protein [Pyrinomonadaceae bacterium]